MDWRWLLLSLAAAAVAAVRLRRRPVPPDVTARPEPGVTPGLAPGLAPGATPAAGPTEAVDGPDPVPPTDPVAEPGLDRSLDRALDASLERRSRPPGRGGDDAAGRADRAGSLDHPGSPGHTGSPDHTGSLDHPDHPDHPDDDDDDEDPIGPEAVDAALERVWAEHAGEADTLLETRLRLLVHRGVPARAVRPAPGTRTVRVVFADGTVVLCRGTGQGDFGRLGLAMMHHSVRLGSFRRGANGTRLEFRWHPDQRLAAVAVGLDQPD